MNPSSLLTGRYAALVGIVYVTTQTLKLMFPSFMASKWGQRLLPILPLLVGVLFMVLAPYEATTSWRDKLVVGVVAGWAAGNVFKIGKTTLLGWGIDEATPANPKSSTTLNAPR